MSDSPEQDLVVAVATELAVDPSFVEKDWHATQLIATVAAVTPDDLQPVFSGGTSLSKGYRLIRRFSEDVDFKVATPANGIGRGARSRYRAAIVRAIRSQKGWTLRDRAFRTQYREFVAVMCYGTGDETPEYESAVSAVARLGQLLP